MNSNNKYVFKDVEKKWREFWEKEKVYVFNKKSKAKPYVVDTPPPTVSGKMHLGHAFSYTQQDIVVRYHRMKGDNVFFPFGTDDNGLPTEKLVEKLKNVRSTKMSRHEFVELCEKTIEEIKPDFINDWKLVGMSCDFSKTYSTIDEHCIRTSQKSFIDLFKKKLVYQSEDATMWCVHCQTAIAQADLEDKERESKLNYVKVEVEGGSNITFATTRPELMMACIAISVHPEDKRYKNLIGKKATIPISNIQVPIIADDFSKIEFGTGAVYWCPYGDIHDLQFVRKHPELEVIHILDKDGKLNDKAGKYKGMSVKEARELVLEDWKEAGVLVKQEPLKQVVNVHERCGTEIEFLSTKQWFIKVLDNKKKFIDEGKKINWYPQFMRLRYEHWIQGLQWDWCISRQRHFGVPFPVWYCKNCSEVIIADEKQLPVDPLNDKPKTKCKCGNNEFEAEKDVMDTWATSSVTPQIILNWVKDNVYDFDFDKMYPCSLRPQAHDIIRTWAFYTIVKGLYHHNKLPWKDIVISGHVLDPKGQAMHKSKGNAIEPAEVLDKYGADALRFWAAGSKLGDDLRYLEKELSTGQRTVTKLWNSFNFARQHLDNYKLKKVELEIIDKWILNKLNNTIQICTQAFEVYEYSKAKAAIDIFFWKDFCDNYLEFVKYRIYSEGKSKERDSSLFTLYTCLLNILKLFAPIMPYITEQLYQDIFKDKEKDKSLHISTWPIFDKNLVDKKSEKIGNEFVEVVSFVRKEKSSKGKSLKEPLKLLNCYTSLKLLDKDLKAVTQAKEIKYGKELKIEF
ncbi:valine--tRNA ligase [Candidatus Woesearchaeota archaeon]|nr:valine--tRNA ligase [Candidatus Woesearchaeota archaeon]